MNEFLLQNEAAVRGACFLGLLAVVGAWEWLAPRRRLRQSKGVRWLNNLGIVVVDTLVLRLVFPVLAVGVAAVAAERAGAC